ncbi:hypothetical protein PTKIN_Ptkin19aG0050800 [Pterospermum kingtungense]
MATHLLSFRPTGIHARDIPSHPKPDPNRRKSTSPSSSSSINWWTPLFGLSFEPDYIDSNNKAGAKEKRECEPEMNLGQKTARSKFSPGWFTEEKAKQLRMMTTNSSSFHDVMYHSAIASRLASDFKNRSHL